VALRKTHGGWSRWKDRSREIRTSIKPSRLSIWISVRRFDTRMGTMYLMVPKLRNGGYIPFFVEAKKRSEAALMNVIQEAYVNGVSTRKIEKLTKTLGIESISRSQVSVITKDLNEQVEAFRNRKLKLPIQSFGSMLCMKKFAITTVSKTWQF